MANLSTHECSSLTHHVNTFTIELYKCHKYLSRAISSYLFVKNNTSFIYLRNQILLFQKLGQPGMGLTIRCNGSVIWYSIPAEMKSQTP